MDDEHIRKRSEEVKKPGNGSAARLLDAGDQGRRPPAATNFWMRLPSTSAT